MPQNLRDLPGRWVEKYVISNKNTMKNDKVVHLFCSDYRRCNDRMIKIKNRFLPIINVFFAIPIVVSIVFELIFYLIIYPLKLFNTRWDFFCYPLLIGYYLIPYFGWFAIVPISSYLIGLKNKSSFFLKICLGLLLVVYLCILAYTIWWWVTKQQFVWL